MEEKTEITERKLEVQKNYLDSIFNPAQFKISYPSEPTETDFLNEEKNGVIISSMYSRDHISIFSKPIKNLISEYELTNEEREALNKAKESIKN